MELMITAQTANQLKLILLAPELKELRKFFGVLLKKYQSSEWTMTQQGSRAQ